MVDAPKENNGDDKEDPVEDKPPEIQSKRQRQRRCSKSHRSKDSNTGTGDDNTPDGAEDTEEPDEQTAEQDHREDGQVSPDEQARPNDSEDGSYHPLSEDEESLGIEDFIVPEDPVEQDRLSIAEFSAADIFRHSPLGDVPNSLKKSILSRGFTAELYPVRTRS